MVDHSLEYETMTTANGTMNARTARKSLADQIDRLDTILDGLAEALNESVADAVRDVIALTVREAVHAAVTEVLSSPDLLRAALEKHAPMATLSVPPVPEVEPITMKEKVAGIASRLCAKAKQVVSLAKQKVSKVGKQAAQIAVNAPTILKTVAKAAWAFRKPCAIAVGVGVACATVCYLGGQVFSSIANGASSAALTLSAMTLPLKRLFWGGSR
jgi:hypothetical protein